MLQLGTIKKITKRAFRNKVIQGLLENYEVKQSSVRFKNSTEMTNNRLSQKHFPAMFEGKKINCVACSILPAKCKLKGKGACK